MLPDESHQFPAGGWSCLALAEERIRQDDAPDSLLLALLRMVLNTQIFALSQDHRFGQNFCIYSLPICKSSLSLLKDLSKEFSMDCKVCGWDTCSSRGIHGTVIRICKWGTPQSLSGRSSNTVHDVFSRNQCPFEMFHSEPWLLFSQLLNIP